MGDFGQSAPAAADASYVVPFIVNGKEVRPEGEGRTHPVVNPATGKVIHQYSGARPDDAKAAVDAAKAAFPVWRNYTPRARRDVLLRAAEIMKSRFVELAGYQETETGQPRSWSDFDVNAAAELITDAAGLAFRANTGRAPRTQDPSINALVLDEPYGVVVAIAPWNAPYILGTRAVVFPLAAGNTVVLKGSELSPRIMWAIASVFNEAGVPPGTVNVVYAAPGPDAATVTETLVAHPAVRKINFTGSTAVGRILGKLAGEHLKPLLLELGGKASAIVWSDANLDLAAEKVALGAFLNAGQICMSTERVIVHRPVQDAFSAKLTATLAAIFGAPSEERSAQVLIRPQAVAKAKALVEDALGKGATLVGPTTDVATAVSIDGRMRPLVVAGVRRDMDLFYTESFAPTVSLFVVDTEEEALALANDTEYGLTAAVFTEDLRRGLRFARGIESGAVHINDMTVHDEPILPHGGVKASGYGRFNTDLSEWLQTKTITYRV
ncbi:hypothetical protein SCUCBS95973_006287 [Sporothrix curviconia]|uniref:Aldehyde dehydrogenase domain-containing protein n=1 Tax=Sporothrix curviconia TaxID=1260050 RepID=A0ABP0C6D1_9PEZI